MSLSKFLDLKNDLAFKRIFGSEKNKHILIDFIDEALVLKSNEQIQEVNLQPFMQGMHVVYS